MTLVGMGLMAGTAVGLAGTAASASTTPGTDGHGPALTEHSSSMQGHHDGRGQGGWDGNRGHGRSRTYSVGLFKGRQACETAGHLGERVGYWDDSTCSRVGRSHVFLLRATDYPGRHRTSTA